MLDEAGANGGKLEVTALVDGFYAEVQAMGGSRWDTSSLVARLEKSPGGGLGGGEVGWGPRGVEGGDRTGGKVGGGGVGEGGEEWRRRGEGGGAAEPRQDVARPARGARRRRRRLGLDPEQFFISASRGPPAGDLGQIGSRQHARVSGS